jgi:hypothetical protein
MSRISRDRIEEAKAKKFAKGDRKGGSLQDGPCDPFLEVVARERMEKEKMRGMSRKEQCAFLASK